MNRRCVGLCAIALVTIPALLSSSVAQAKSLKDQLVGTWIYVSSTGKREDGSAVPRPSAQGAVTYTADGHFHFITVRTEVPRAIQHDRHPRKLWPLHRAWLPTRGLTRWTKARGPLTLTSRRVRFRISSERPISAGSSRRLPMRN